MEVACTGKDWWTNSSQTASCSSWMRAREKTDGPVVIRHLVTHHGGVHGKDWWTCGGQITICSSWRRHARTKIAGPVAVMQLVADYGGGVHGQRLVDLW